VRVANDQVVRHFGRRIVSRGGNLAESLAGNALLGIFIGWQRDVIEKGREYHLFSVAPENVTGKTLAAQPRTAIQRVGPRSVPVFAKMCPAAGIGLERRRACHLFQGSAALLKIRNSPGGWSSTLNSGK